MALPPALRSAYQQALADFDQARPSSQQATIRRFCRTERDAGFLGAGHASLPAAGEKNPGEGGGSGGVVGDGVVRGKWGHRIYRVRVLTREERRRPWLIARPAGVRYDRLGQRWSKVRPWLGDWAHVLERGGHGEAGRLWARVQVGEGRGVAVYGILGGYGLLGRRFGRAGLVPRRAFPAGEARYEGVWGWRAQLVAWYVRRRWPVLACWPRWRDAVRVGARRRGERAKRHRVGPTLGAGLATRLDRVIRGEAAWTVGLERAVVGRIAAVRAEIGRLEELARPVKREKAPIRLRIQLLPNSPR
jgi:hypothetical protein